MESKLVLYNTLTRRKEVFEPLTPGRVGMYVCGPTVYGDPHLGHARPAVTFDLMFRYLKSCGYKVRYVRNITDVGHLEHDADEGEDKIAKKARLEQLEPMEVAHYYTERYHRAMDALNVETPSIEPYASGHIIEQIEFVKKILADGFAYESNGSVYFDVEKYNAKYNYGRLSGRNLDDIIANTRELVDGQQSITAADLEELKATVYRYTFDILGLRDEKAAGAASGRDYVTPLVEMLLDERLKARAAKDWAASDRIRDGLAAAGIRVKDRKDGSDWELE